MYKLYMLQNTESGCYYIGMTKNSLQRRFNEHQICATRGQQSPLYDAMRYYNFEITLLSTYETRSECCDAEIDMIKECRSHTTIYNIADGGDGGYVVPDSKKDEWKRKLSTSRQGKKPALGMKHSDENKLYFSKVSKEYWASQKTYNADLVTSLSLLRKRMQPMG